MRSNPNLLQVRGDGDASYLIIVEKRGATKRARGASEERFLSPKREDPLCAEVGI